MPAVAQSADLVVVDEAGEVVERPSDVHDFVAKAINASQDESRLLRYFDPYGTLVLNEEQMTDFLLDWDAAEPLAVSSHERETWAKVRDLAKRVQGSNVLFLRLLGD